MGLDVKFDTDSLVAAVKTRFRAETAAIPEYLLSRSNAGATHEDLIAAVQEVTDGACSGRFFHMYPCPDIELTSWIIDWIRKGRLAITHCYLHISIFRKKFSFSLDTN